jgi:hypothetical protein
MICRVKMIGVGHVNVMNSDVALANTTLTRYLSATTQVVNPQFENGTSGR